LSSQPLGESLMLNGDSGDDAIHADVQFASTFNEFELLRFEIFIV
jgi:hypothetical protein